MLLNLQIRDFAIVDNLEIDFSPGMSALTGETGAGKSILLGALGLLLGDRADAASVRHGQERAQINADFNITHCPAARGWLHDHDMDNAEECQLRRVISREGRSRAYINGSSVPVTLLRELGEQLVDIHGQHEHQSLLRRDLQRSLLDNHGKHKKLLQSLALTHHDWHRTRDDIKALTGGDQDRDTRLEFLNFQLQELDALAPQPSESEQLHTELARLSNASQLIDTCRNHLQSLYEADNSAHSLLGKAVADLAAQGEVEPGFKEPGELFNAALIQLQEGIDQLRNVEEQLQLDPERLQWVEQRLDALHSTARKHRIETEQLSAYHECLQQDIANLEQADQKLDTLEKRQAELEQTYQKNARQLHNKRVKTAAHISRQVCEAMQALGMQGGRFDIQVNETESDKLSAHGIDTIEFLVSANPGQPLQELRKVASGGELSRISLAIQVVAAQDTDIPTLIFDEIDSGVGGAVAETVGRQLQTLGVHRQVLCVTHLPQVAAQAHNHLQVQKQTDRKTTRTGVERLSQSQRIDEIARMLGGQKITDSTLQHAQEMLLMAPQSDASGLNTH
ncbi:DNA repair protein RecN [hydrothermal vent metagenome]|uniref:DNA repair protein RecN n=1 Tax=hydrothermal vent metagenome TaxID=652676 RepID=A0A3B0Z790_9ZZZZ